MRPTALKLNLGLGKTEYWRSEAINIDPVSKVPVGLNTDYYRMDYDDLDHYFEPESVDEVWMNDMIVKLSIENLKRTLAQIARLLRPGGDVYVDRGTGNFESTSVSYFVKLVEDCGLVVVTTERLSQDRIYVHLKRRTA